MEHVFSCIDYMLQKDKSAFICFVDMKKAFDWINRNLLHVKLLGHDIGGNMVDSIRAMYDGSSASIKLNDILTNEFEINSGMNQGDTLSPTLYGIFINEINQLNCGIKIDDVQLSILLYADDICLIADNEPSLQLMLDTVYNWCNKWQLLVNLEKAKIIHFRKERKNETKLNFTYGNDSVEMVKTCKYLGIIFDEHLTFNAC